MISILKIEIDGHFHGSANVPKPWVAEITGTDPKFGLARRFIDPMNDWREARAAWSGNVYGRVSCFALRDGGLYEVQRLKGKPSKRHVVREFVAVTGGKREPIEPEEALARVDGGGEATRFKLPDEGDTWVARVRGLGTPERLGWVVVAGERVYRLRPGVYEVVEGGARRFVGTGGDHVETLDELEAWSWLQASAQSA